MSDEIETVGRDRNNVEFAAFFNRGLAMEFKNLSVADMSRDKLVESIGRMDILSDDLLTENLKLKDEVETYRHWKPEDEAAKKIDALHSSVGSLEAERRTLRREAVSQAEELQALKVSHEAELKKLRSVKKSKPVAEDARVEGLKNRVTDLIEAHDEMEADLAIGSELLGIARSEVSYWRSRCKLSEDMVEKSLGDQA